MNNRIKWLLEQLSLKVLLVAGLFLIALFLFAYIAHEAVFEQEDAFDARVHAYLLAHTTSSLIKVMGIITFLGSSSFLLPAYILLVGTLLIFKKKRYATDISIIALSSFLLMQVLKRVFHRSRPQIPIIKAIHTYSFPSGHSLSSFIFCSILAYLVWQGSMHTAWKIVIIILLSILAVAIGISRIVLNVHYATDVIAGFCLGVIWVIVSLWIMRKINRHRSL